MLRLLKLALSHIQAELNAAGEDEVKQHPILRGKQEFVDRTRAQIRRWEDE